MVLISICKYTNKYFTIQKTIKIKWYILGYLSYLNKNMKAKEVMEFYGITRNTLSNWVKKKQIEIKITPSGRYIYILKK